MIGRCSQSGWLLLELLLSWAIGALVVIASLHFFLVSYSRLIEVMQVSNRVTLFEKWLLWMQDALDDEQAKQHCGSGDSPWLQSLQSSREELLLHSCRWFEQRWQWVNTRYYVKSKQGVNYLYEKTENKPAVGWISDIHQLKLQFMDHVPLKASYHLLKVDLIGAQVQQGINTSFVFGWHD